MDQNCPKSRPITSKLTVLIISSVALLIMAAEGHAHPIDEADAAFESKDHRRACVMYEALSEIGYLYAKNQSKTPSCVTVLANIDSKSAEVNYLKGKTIWESGSKSDKANEYLGQSAKSGNGHAAFMLYEITKSEKWLEIAADLNHGKATTIMAERQQQKLFQAERERAKPQCRNVRFTGYASVFPQNIQQVYESKRPDKLAAHNPIICTHKEWGGRYLPGGAVINRNRMTECSGVVFFTNKDAIITDWTETLFRVQTEVDFDIGRRPLLLFIRRTDAKCVE